MRDVSSHTASVEQIVGRVLQLWSSKHPVHKAARPEEVESLLRFDLEAAELAIDQANEEGQDNDVLLPLKSNLTNIRDCLETGARVRCELMNEVEVFRRDAAKSSLVVIIQTNEGDIYNSEDIRVTTVAAYYWVKNAYEVDIPEWGPAKRTVAELESALEIAKAYKNSERDKHLITIAGLLDLIAEKQGGRYLEKGDPNRAYIGDQVHEALKKAGIELPGYSAETLRDRFSEAIKVKKEHVTPK